MPWLAVIAVLGAAKLALGYKLIKKGKAPAAAPTPAAGEESAKP